MFYLLLANCFFVLSIRANLIVYEQITCDKLEAAQTDLDENFGGFIKKKACTDFYSD